MFELFFSDERCVLGIISVPVCLFVISRTCCQFNFLVPTNLTWSDRGWPGYSHPESEASGAQGGCCSLLPVGQVRALECTVPLRRHGPECLEQAVGKVDRWLYSTVRKVSNIYIKKVISEEEKSFKIYIYFFFAFYIVPTIFSPFWK